MTPATLQVHEAPLVSVVMPSYNKGPHLREAVESIINQDYPHVEILIVNDGSPDNTVEVAQKIISDYPKHRIQLINKQNGGVSDARNAGLARADGEYIITMDGDDKADPKFISTGLRQIAAANANLFYCNVDIFGAHPGEWRPHPYTDFGIRYDNCIPILSLFSRTLYEKSGGYKVALGFSEDWEFWVNCSRYGISATKSEDKLFLYRSHDSGIAGVYIHDGYRECLAVVVANNHDLYPVEQVLAAHGLMLTIRKCSFTRANELDAMHPNQWFLKFWFALKEEECGDYQQALEHYTAAINLSGLKNWQPIFRLAVLLDYMGKRQDAEHLFFIVKTLRPDMSRIVRKFFAQGDHHLPPPRTPLPPLLYRLPNDELEECQ